jgi:hypothetical protein
MTPMCKQVRAAIVAFVTAVAVVGSVGAADSGPGRIYSDFARDGVLSCGHPTRDLRAVLNDPSIYQYGDPVTLNRLKLAIRRQLARGCPGISGEESAITEGRMVLVGSILLLVTLGTGGWAARRVLLTRR